jgi:hypothetical protein
LSNTGIDLFGVNIDYSGKLLDFIKENNLDKNIGKNLFSISSNYKNKNYNSLSFAIAQTEYPTRRGDVIYISLFDLFLISEYCSYWICNEFFFTFFSNLSMESNAVVIGEEHKYKNTLYQYFVNKKYPDNKKGQYKYIEKFDTKKIDEIIG